MSRGTDPASRVEALLAAMSLAEKIGQLTMVRPEFAAGSADTITDSQKAGIRAGQIGSMLDIWGAGPTRAAQTVAVNESQAKIPLLFCYDVLHGYETVFPVPLGEAAAFDPDLWERTARAAAEEAAAGGVALTFAPMLDVARDPRWGRIVESFGEDAWLGRRFAEAKVRGFQGESPADAGAVAATAKHLGAYGAVTAGREYASVDVSERALHEVHLPPFRAAVEAGAAAIMPAFNDLNGVPMTGNAEVLRGIVRARWAFDGVMISDFGAVGELMVHGVAGDLAEAAALALGAGVDIDMASDAYPKGLPEALARGLVTEAQIDEAVRRVLVLKERLGLLDAPFARGGAALSEEKRQAHRALAREAACRSMVLLRDRDGLLPLQGEARHLAIIGPLADAGAEMLGPWSAAGKADDTVGYLAGLRAALPGWTISHSEGARREGGTAALLDDALDLVRAADLTLLCIGETPELCGEAGSRAEPGLPDWQRPLTEAVLGAGKPVIVALTCGRPLIAPWLFEQAGTVLAAWFPGSEAGNALADVLTGRLSPSGKLPVSWPRAVGQIPIFFGQSATGRPADPAERLTSRYLDVASAPLFPFGHGLSYARFEYRDLRVTPAVARPGDGITVEVDIANSGAREGRETAFLFIRDPVASVARPVLELRGAAGITLAPGEAGSLRFSLKPDDLAFSTGEGTSRLEPGRFEILAGPSADRASLLQASIELRMS